MTPWSVQSTRFFDDQAENFVPLQPSKPSVVGYR